MFQRKIYPFLEESTQFSPSVYQICLIHWFSKSKTGILHVFLRHHVMESAKMIYFIGGKCSNKVFIIILLLFLLFIRSSLLVFSITWVSWLNQVLFEQWANIFVLYLFHLFLNCFYHLDFRSFFYWCRIFFWLHYCSFLSHFLLSF